MADHTAENGACPASVTYTPVDGETGNPLPEHTARCVSPPGHIGLHMGDDRMPFGPPVKRPIPPGSGDTEGSPS